MTRNALRRLSVAVLLGTLLRVPGAWAAFEDLGAGARAPGMGNAFVAVADDVYALHYNPAGLALHKRPELGTSYTRLLAGLSDNSELSTTFFGYSHPLREGRRGTLGASWEQFKLNSSLYQEQVLTLGYGRLLREALGPGTLYGGLGLKYLRRSFGSFPEASNAMRGMIASGQADPVLSGRRSMGAPDADLGLLYRLREHYSLGMALQHITQPNVAFSASDSDKVPMAVKLGLCYQSLLSNLGVQYETNRSVTGSRDQRLALALERWFPRLFVGDIGLRGALGLGSRGYQQLTMGASYRTGRVSVDYGFALPINSIASTAGSHRMAISFRFGGTKEPDESVLMILEAMRQIKQGVVPELQALGTGLSPSQKVLLDEHLALAKSLEGQAKYQAALERLGQALAISPADTDLLKSFGRLNWVAQQVPGLAEYKIDPLAAAWHQGILAYLAFNDQVAIEKVSYALGLNPGHKALDGFLAQLEVATGIRRLEIAKAVEVAKSSEAAAAPEAARPPEKRYLIEQQLMRAAAAIEAGRYEEAIDIANGVLKEEDNLTAWEDLGTCFFALAEYESSLAAWEKAYALEKSPARRTVLSNYIKSIRNLLAKAKAPLKPGVIRVKASPREIQRVYNAGVDAYTGGRLKEAKAAFEKVLEMDPDYVPASKALKRVLEEMGGK